MILSAMSDKQNINTKTDVSMPDAQLMATPWESTINQGLFHKGLFSVEIWTS